MKAEQWCLDLVCADPMLRWLILFLAAGTVFWYTMLHILSKGFLVPPTAAAPEGKRFSVFRLQLPFSHKAFRQFLEQLPDRTVKLLRWSLWVDFVFMAFVYPLLAVVAWYLLRHRAGGWGWQAAVLCAATWLPFVAWGLDILENILSFACLKQLSPFKSRLLLLTALLKWAAVLAVVTGLLSAGLSGCC